MLRSVQRYRQDSDRREREFMKHFIYDTKSPAKIRNPYTQNKENLFCLLQRDTQLQYKLMCDKVTPEHTNNFIYSFSGTAVF
jgi:hypothetical protein